MTTADAITFVEENLNVVIQLGLNVVYAVLILVISYWVSGRVKAFLSRVGDDNSEIDDTLFTFLGSLAQYLILALAVIFVLNRFGIQTTSLVALLGAAGLAIGLALQGTLSNIAAGVMLVAFRPFKLKQFVELAGYSGTVKQITLFTTEISTLDNVQITIPNGQVWDSAIKNYSAYDTRMVDLTIGVGYSADLKLAEKVMTEIVETDSRSHTAPAPFIKVTNLGESSVDFKVRVWCAASDYWNLKCDLTRAIKDRFDEEGIEIPFPTRTFIQAST